MKNQIFAKAGRMLVLGLAVAFLTACSSDSGDSGASASRHRAEQNFGRAVQSLNAPENFIKRSGESDQDLNDRRLAALVLPARQLLLASGVPEKPTAQMDDAQAVSRALRLYVTSKTIEP